MMEADPLKDFWLVFFNACWRHELVPSMWRKSIIVPVPKSRCSGPCVPDKFRGISLTSIVSKMLTTILNKRLTVVVEDNGLVANEQAGFRKGYSCMEQVLSLVLLGQSQVSMKREGMLVAYIDFLKAYDRIDRMKLWSCLSSNGICGRFLNFLKTLYEDSSCQGKLGNIVSEGFPVHRGLRQGCVLSPLLFSLYINSLIVELKRNCCGVQCGSKEIPGLLFADDTTLLGEDADGLTKALGILECWCQE